MKHQLPEVPDKELGTPKRLCRLKKNAIWLFQRFPNENNEFWRPALSWDVKDCDCKPKPYFKSWAKAV